ncbi:hypothetical protein PR048_025155 [Dryococelus australis]|uniref:Uncharacterized protein n=1 Tax=Dryococelus australis TaxID=614101 RepID=A0ABQ9GQL1_9NEOP|nr:hypothetical protein PR048_025155 [Dryococelus australis]
MCARIHRLADLSMSVTPNVMKRKIFTFCEVNQLEHLFNKTAGLSGKKRLDIAKRKSQKELDELQKPQSVFNMDEKGTCLCLRKQPVILTKQ